MARFDCFLVLPPDANFPFLTPGLKVELKGAGSANQQAGVVVSRNVDWAASGRVTLLGNVKGPGHSAHADKELLLDQIHAHADAAAVAEGGEVLNRGKLGQRLLVGRVAGKQPALWVEAFRIGVHALIAGDGPGSTVSSGRRW